MAEAPQRAYGEWSSGAAPEARLSARERMRLALGERLPVWVQLRCGMEPKTLAALALVLLVALGFAVHHFWTGRPASVAVPGEAAGKSAAVGAREDAALPVPGGTGQPAVPGGASGKRLVIDVAGKVREPGVHRLPSGSRVGDALDAAGGLRPGADTSGLNRARVLIDGEQIVVGPPKKGAAGAAAVPAPSPGAPPQPGGAGGAGAASGTPGASGASGTPVSLSSATAEQLETLPGVGPVLAQHIIEYRTQHGGFRSVDQLQEVNGIGEKRFADIKPQVGP